MNRTSEQLQVGFSADVLLAVQSVYARCRVYSGPKPQKRPRPAVINRLSKVPAFAQSLSVSGWLEVGYPQLLAPRDLESRSPSEQDEEDPETMADREQRSEFRTRQQGTGYLDEEDLVGSRRGAFML